MSATVRAQMDARIGLSDGVELPEMDYSGGETDSGGNDLDDTLPRPRVRLDSMLRLRREMTRVYIEARDGRRPVSDAARLSYMLGMIGRTIESCEMEDRLAALEAKNGKA
jgi:hypothetical protein